MFIFIAFYVILIFDRVIFVKQCFARFNASRLMGVVGNFYSLWCIIVWCTFL